MEELDDDLQVEEPKGEHKRRRRAKAKRERELNDLRAILSTDEGRRFINRLFGQGNVFHTTFTGNSKTFFNEGGRNLALWVMNECEQADPDMLKEAMFLIEKDDEDDAGN